MSYYTLEDALGHAQTALRKTQNLYFEAMNLMQAVKEDPYSESGYWGVETLKDQLLPMIEHGRRAGALEELFVNPIIDYCSITVWRMIEDVENFIETYEPIVRR